MDYKGKTARSNDEALKAIPSFFPETESESIHLSNTDYIWSTESSVSNKCTEPPSEQSISNIVLRLKQIIPQIDDSGLKHQVEHIKYIISCALEITQQLKGNIPIPPLHVSKEENSVLIEWIFPDFRVTFNIETNPENSGIHIISGKGLDEFIYSESLKNIQDIRDRIIYLFQYILANI